MEKSNVVDKAISNSAPVLVEKTSSVVTNSSSNESLLQQLTSNKLYIYIIIAIVVLAFIGYYLYTKHFSKKEKNEKSDKSEKNQDNDQSISLTKKELESKKHILSPDTEYYLLDRSGNPILMNHHFTNFLQHNHEQPIMVNNKITQQEMLKPKVSQQRPKLTHPNEDLQDEVNITDNEDDNIANQDLTREEIEELKKQLSLMQRKQTAPITAENDEDGDAADF